MRYALQAYYLGGYMVNKFMFDTIDEAKAFVKVEKLKPENFFLDYELYDVNTKNEVWNTY